MEDCIFCRIVRGEIPSPRVREGEAWIAIRDINPAAPVHVLVIPREHVESVAHLGDGDVELAGRLLVAAGEVARQEGVAESGYRVVVNTGREGGQTVPHLHLHVIGGRQLTGHGTA
ncbi:MAG TPA: histidine triad nucleotide-binding protein [Longimicrobiaceae bacterium]|nr:histidine triad nucleotide-binding protein [Longimicrobiaceae bacterium]